MPTTYTYLGHGTHLLETSGHKILIDPFLDSNPSAPVKAADIACDFILVSHGHNDHIADAPAIARRTGAPCYANAKVAAWLKAQGAPEAKTLYFGGRQQLPFGEVMLTLAFHGSSLPDGSDGGSPGGFLITTAEDGKCIYFAADTALFGDMALYGEEGLDLAVLPIGGHYTMGPKDALRAVKLLNPKHVVPCHYNTFPAVQQDAEAWAAQVRAETSASPHILKPGESLAL